MALITLKESRLTDHDDTNLLLAKILVSLVGNGPSQALIEAQANYDFLAAIAALTGSSDDAAAAAAALAILEQLSDSERDGLLATLVLQGNLSRPEMAVVSGTFVRPANVTPYAPNDVVGDGASIVTLKNVGRVDGGSGYITNVRLVKSTPTVTNALFRLWLYSAAPDVIADNAPFTVLWANRDKRLGFVDLPMFTEGTGSDAASAFIANLNLKFKCRPTSRNLWAVLEAKQAYTPGSSEAFFIEVTADQN